MKQVRATILFLLILTVLNISCFADQVTNEHKVNIIKAIKNGEIETVRKYVESGADLNKTHLSQSILLTSIKKRQFEIADILLEGGANPNIGKMPPLYYSTVVKPNYEISAKLLKYGADLNKKIGGTTIQAYSIAKAINKRDDRMLNLLIKNGADPNAKYGSVPLLYHAVSEKNIYAVKKLLEAGADQNKTFMKETPEQCAVTRNYEEILQIFNNYNMSKANKYKNDDNSFGGIGAGIFKEPYNHKTIVYMTLPDSPASVIPVGSEIIKINNQKTQTMSEVYITSILRGKIGTQVNIVTKDKYNNQHEYILTRKQIIMPKETDKRFDIHWKQVAPDGFENIALEPNAIISKLSNKFMLEDGNAIQYWFDRKKAFTRGYNACLSYPKSEQNACLINLVNREIAQTENDRQAEIQQAMIQQQARQNYINDTNQRAINNSLQNINNSLQQQNFYRMQINNNLQNINNSLMYRRY